MTDSFLREQVSQRASNSDRLSSLISQTKGTQFEEWKDDSNKLFNQQLNDYSTKAGDYIQEKIASETEGSSVLTNVPHFYSLGTGFYKNVLGSRGQAVFDNSAEGIKFVKDAVNQKIADKTGVNLEEGIGDIKTRVSNITDQLEGNTPETSTKLYNYKGVQTAETPVNEMSAQNTEMLDRSNNPFRNTDEIEETPKSFSPELEVRNNLGNIQNQSPEEIWNRGDVSNQLSEAENNAIKSSTARLSKLQDVTAGETGAETGAETAGATAGAEVGAEVGGETAGLIGAETGLASADAGLASTGVGAPLAGILAVGGAIAFGLDELFHHSHRPKAPVLPIATTTGAITTPYNISSTILPSGSSLQQMQGSMTF